MFRFLALSWNPCAPTASHLAQQALSRLQTCGRWGLAWRRPGLAVLMTGGASQIHQAHPIADGRGVAVGTVFEADGHRVTATSRQGPGARAQAAALDIATDWVTRHWGRYVAFIDGPDGQHHVLRDPTGTLPCFHRMHDGVTWVFSWLEDLLNPALGLPLPRVDEDALSAQLAFGELTGHRMPLQGIFQVLPGELLPLGDDPGAPVFAWDARRLALQPTLMNTDAASTALRATTRCCVQAWARCYPGIVLRLSGGVDSSIVAGCLAAQQAPPQVTCLNYHSPGADSDERVYARLAANRSGLPLVEVERDPDFELPRVMGVAPMVQPTQYIGRMGAHTDASVAHSVGAAALFTGGGGDQLFFEFSHWWPAADHLRVRGLGHGFLDAAMAAARLGRQSLWRTVALSIADRFRQRPPALHLQRPWTLVTDAVWAAQAQAERHLHPAQFEACDLPMGKLMQVLQLTHFAGYYDPYARERAPELVNPLLSQPLIELCLRLPTDQLTLGGRGRGLARKAFAQDLPPEIVERRSKGGMQEQLAILLQRHLGWVKEVLLDGELVRRGLLDRQRTESALCGGPGAAPGTVAELHMHIAHEAWLRPWCINGR